MTDEQLVERFPPSEVELVMGIGSLWPCDDRSHRAWIAKRFLDQGYRFPPIVHPFSWVAPGVSIGMGSQIMAGVVVQPGSRIGDFSIINTRASVDHDCTVGNHCHLAPGVTLSGSVVIGDGTHLGTSCSVVQAVRLEKCSFIAAGATVTQSFPCGVYLRGTPARPFEPTRSRKMELPDAE
jgi:UDP-perosamine 4-acetyltransferase